jgi:hypothetical protein
MMPPTNPLFCVCWCCDSQCGGAQDENSCGPTEPNADGHQVCAACRATADVLDDDRTGARATIGQDRVRLAVGTFGIAANIWLTAASARELARILNQRAAELEAQES